MIFTFYSYKGGVGRSLALAHVAHAFAERGLRVLMVDFDLEAPGLERYGLDGREAVRTAREHLGLVDLILAYRRTLTSDLAFEAREFRDWKKFVMTLRDPVNALGGRLDLMTAGRRAPAEQLRDYALNVRTFDWVDFFHNWHGDAFFQWLRSEWTRPDIGYDVVLVDSRTGVTEMGGVCAYQLADVAVLLCAPNEQNLEGTLDVMRDFGSPGVLGLRGGRPLKQLAVPARLEPEHPQREAFLRRFADLLGPPPLGAGVPVAYADLAMPYLPAFAIAEPVVGGPVPGASAPVQAAFATLRQSVGRLADALTLLAEPDTALGRRSDEALAALGGVARAEPGALQADTRRRSAGYDFFIDCGGADAKAARALAQQLHERSCEVYIDEDPTGEPRLGARAAETERALDYSACLLVCFGKASTSSAREALLKRARASTRGLQVVPVLLPGARVAALRSFGLDEQTPVDLRRGLQPSSLATLLALRQGAALAAPGREAVEHANPYRGALPYGEDDARLLSGREEDIAQLLQALEKAPLVWVEGAAQVGKTSLVRAGLLPALRERGAAADAPWQVQVHDARLGAAWPRWSRNTGASRRAREYPAAQLIVIDHADDFEAAPTPAAERQRGAALQKLVAGCGPRRRLLLLARGPMAGVLPGATPPPNQAWLAHTVRRLQAQAWRQALTEPAQKSGHLLENGLAERITESAGPAHAALLHAQLALHALWGHRREGWLTNRALDGLGHVAGVFAQHLQGCLAALEPTDRSAAVVLFQSLCRLESTEGLPLAVALPWAQACTPHTLARAGAARLRDRLASQGLIDLWFETPPGARAPACQVALARADARSYFDDATWAAEREFMAWRGRLATTLLPWRDNGQPPGGLLPEAALEEAARWQAQRGDALTALERDYVEASLDAQRLRAPAAGLRARGPETAAQAVVAGAGAALLAPLQVEVLNADLGEVEGPVMIGHYHSFRLTGTEADADRRLDGALSRALHAGLYPHAVGTHQFFNPVRDARVPGWTPLPGAVLVVGLGEEGRLRSADLVHSVRHAVLALLQRQAESRRSEAAGRHKGAAPAALTLNTALMGSGAAGVSTDASAQLVLQGVQEANQRAAAGGWPTVTRLRYVERFHDRACDAWRALHFEAASQPQALTLGFGVEAGRGALRRALGSNYRGVAHDILSVTAGQVQDKPALNFSVDTSRLRATATQRLSDSRLLKELVRRVAAGEARGTDAGRQIFELLVPAEVSAAFRDSQPVVLQLDSTTAALPWELLDGSSRTREGRPWALRTQLLRRLQVSAAVARVNDVVADAGVLVVGDPRVEAPWGVLPGARHEALAVQATLSAAGGLAPSQVLTLADQPDAQAVIDALLKRPWRVLHLCGHGDMPALQHGGGLVLSSHQQLGATELAMMRQLPELVFFQAGHATLSTASETPPSLDLAGFAARCAEDLITAGVRCVITVGGVVREAVALAFATRFYASLLAGQRLLDAVSAARQAAWEADPAGHGWAAYQCYGDADWHLRTATHDTGQLVPGRLGEYADIASPVELALALETLAVRARQQHSPREGLASTLAALEQRYEARWGGIGAVAEAWGLAWQHQGERTRAIHWYERAVSAADASASFRAEEQLLNLQAREAWAPAHATEAGTAARRALLLSVTGRLSDLAARRPTVERLNLLGSTWKRLALLEREDGPARRPEEQRALQASLAAYLQADALAHTGDEAQRAYPLANAWALTLCLAGRVAPFDQALQQALHAALSANDRGSPDFWTRVGLIEFDLLQAASLGKLAERQTRLQAAFTDLHAQHGSPRDWSSVADQAGLALGAYASRRGRGAAAEESRAARAIWAQLRSFGAAAP